jgi:putative membrane protein
MLRTKVVKSVLGLSAVAALFAAVAVHAQTGGGTGGATSGTQPTTGQSTSGQSTSGQTGSQTGDQSGMQGSQSGGQTAGTTASGTGGKALSKSDRKMLMTMAQANLAEIEMGRIAQNKSQSDQVKNFAQQMIDDHTKSLGEVQQLAQSKGITLPSDLDRTHRARADKLSALSGDAFDRAYMAQAGVSDHKKNHSHLRSAQTKARDPDLKALAARTLPVVDQHLNSAQQLHKNTAQGRSGTQGTTGSSSDRSQQPSQQNQQNKGQNQQQQGQPPGQ